MELIDQITTMLPAIIIGFLLLTFVKGVIRTVIKIGLCGMGIYIILQLLGQLPV